MAAFNFRPCYDVMRRPRSPQILPFLTPSIPQNWLYHVLISTTYRKHLITRSSSRKSFSTAVCRFAASQAAAKRPDFLDEPAESEQIKGQNSSKAKKSNAQNHLDRILSGLKSDSKEGMNLASEVQRGFQTAKDNTGDFDWKKMQAPIDGISGSGSGKEMTAEDHRALLKDSIEKIPSTPRNKRTVRSRPEVGRIVEVNLSKGIDFGRALARLGTTLSSNSVRRDQVMQKYYERRGQKRKRLKKERWRKLFLRGFRATVARVREMKRKGW